MSKILLFFCCLLFVPYQTAGIADVVALLAAMSCSCLCSLLPGRRGYWAAGAFWILSLFLPQAGVYLALFVFDTLLLGHWRYAPIWALPWLMHASGAPLQATLAQLILSGLACWMYLRQRGEQETQRAYFDLQDWARETESGMRAREDAFAETQEYEVRIATLDERNRIARDIHDNVGHLLSRALLQAGALQVVNHDPAVGEGIGALQESLNAAMDSVRASVHGMHTDSIDLYTRLDAMVKAFAFCPVRLEYDAGELPAPIQYCFLAVAQEGFNNIMRHSNARHASITVREHPALAQLILTDDGDATQAQKGDGMGLLSIRQRVEALGGMLSIQHEHGFRLFISIPKEFETQ